MFSIQIPLGEESKIGHRMQEMRTWLDHRRVEPRSFRCLGGVNGGRLRIDFTAATDAVAFADAFGRVVSASASPVPARLNP